MKKDHYTKLGIFLACSLFWVSCSDNNSVTKTNLDDKIRFNETKLHTGWASDAPRFTIMVRTKDENVPLYIFVNRYDDGRIYSLQGVDLRKFGDFNLDIRELISSRPAGILVHGKYHETRNEVRLTVRSREALEKATVSVDVEEFPMTKTALVDLLDRSVVHPERVAIPGLYEPGQHISVVTN